MTAVSKSAIMTNPYRGYMYGLIRTSSLHTPLESTTVQFASPPGYIDWCLWGLDSEVVFWIRPTLPLLSTNHFLSCRNFGLRTAEYFCLLLWLLSISRKIPWPIRRYVMCLALYIAQRFNTTVVFSYHCYEVLAREHAMHVFGWPLEPKR